MTNRIVGMTSSKAAVVALLCCVSALVTGCTTSQFLSGTDLQPMVGGAVNGVVHGGYLPVTGATIQMWSVGTGGYGSAASKLGPALTTGAGGGFSYTPGSYNCTGSSLIYITSTGGNPGGGTNNNVVLATALGSCANLLANAATTFITINEVTTAATAYALGQYFTPSVGGPSSADSFGAPNTTQAQAGIANAFATVNNLVNTSTGAAITSGTVTGAAGTLTITPEATKLNTIADILADCVDSTGGTAGDSTGCGKLFSAVVTSSGAAPTDTLQAAVYMSLNPTSNNANGSAANLATLYALVPTQQPFPAASSQPTDWTVGIQYTDTTALTPTLPFPQWVSVDASGNLWVVSGNNAALGGQLIELSPTGQPLQVLLSSSTAGTGVGIANPREAAIDTAGNVWVTSTTGSGYVFEMSPGPTSTTIGTSKIAGKASWGIAIDGSNNVFAGEESASTTVQFGEFPGNSSGGDITKFVEYGNGTTAEEAFVQPEYMAFDTLGNLWTTSGTTKGTINYLVEFSNITPCTTETTTTPCVAGTVASPAANTFTNITPSTFTVPATLSEAIGVATAPSGGIWVASGNVSSVTLLSSATSGVSFGSSTSINLPRVVAVDGGGNAWFSNGTLATAPGTPGAVSEFSSTGTILSTVNSGTAPNTAVGYVHAGINGALGIAIDPSGNVWVANFVSATSNPDPNSIFEIVGAAAPTVTPIALSLKNGTVGLRP